MRLTVNTPPPPADPRDLGSSFEDSADDFADDLDTGEMVVSAFAERVAPMGADDRRPRIRRKPIEG
jgi:hypothetical protein